MAGANRLLQLDRKKVKEMKAQEAVRKAEFEKKMNAAAILATALGLFVKRSMTYFMTKLYQPGMEEDMRRNLVNAVREGLGKALEAAITVKVNERGIVMPIFDDDRFVAELEKEIKE